MMTKCLLVLLVCHACSAAAEQQQGKIAVKTQTNPIAKILELMSNLQAKIIKEGEEEQKIYEEFAEWYEIAKLRLRQLWLRTNMVFFM